MPIGRSSQRAYNRAVESLRHTRGGADVTVSIDGDGPDAASVALFLNDAAIGERVVTGHGRTTVSFDGIELEPGDNRLRAELFREDTLAVDDANTPAISASRCRC